MYMIDRYVVGGFYRVHARARHRREPERAGLAIRAAGVRAAACRAGLKAKPGTAAPNRFYMYGVVARLGLLAASLEMERTDPNPEVY